MHKKILLTMQKVVLTLTVAWVDKLLSLKVEDRFHLVIQYVVLYNDKRGILKKNLLKYDF
jgi:hypothetical protein